MTVQIPIRLKTAARIAQILAEHEGVLEPADAAAAQEFAEQFELGRLKIAAAAGEPAEPTPAERSAALLAELQTRIDEAAALEPGLDRQIGLESATSSRWYLLFGMMSLQTLRRLDGKVFDLDPIAAKCDELRRAELEKARRYAAGDDAMIKVEQSGGATVVRQGRARVQAMQQIDAAKSETELTAEVSRNELHGPHDGSPCSACKDTSGGGRK